MTQLISHLGSCFGRFIPVQTFNTVQRLIPAYFAFPLEKKKLTSQNHFSTSCLKFQFLNSNPSGRIGDSILSFFRRSHPSCIFSINFFSLRDPPGDDSGSSHSPGFRIPQFFGPKDVAQHSPFLECGVERSVYPDWANRIKPDLEKCFFRKKHFSRSGLIRLAQSG